MKKLFALVLALMMAMTCLSAFADTVYTQVTVDRDLVKELLPGLGVPEEQSAMIDPILALVNALGVKVTTVADGAQIDLDLNGQDALSLGYATDDAGVTVASTLFPNYVLTISQETISQIVEQVMSNMPVGGSGEGGMMDMNAVTEVFGGYFQRWFEACATAGQPGDPVPGEYEFEGYTFNTMVPVTVDMPAIKEATASLMDELMADPAAMAMIKGYAQGFAQNSGETFDDANFEAEFKAGFEEWLAHFPDAVTAEVYANDDGSATFYMTAASTQEGAEEPFFTCDMLFVDEQNMKMGFQMAGETPMEAGFAMEGTDMRMDFTMGEIYFGLGMSFPGNEFDFDVYFLTPDAPILCVKVTVDAGGERTLAVDGAGKTAVAIELPMDGNDEALQGLLGDIMANGLGSLMGALSAQVPEAMSLMGMAS